MGDVHWEYIRCSRCKEQIPVRVDLRNELTPQYEEGEGAYYVRKGIVGSGRTRCFRTIEVELFFNSDRQLVSRYITGGEFIKGRVLLPRVDRISNPTSVARHRNAKEKPLKKRQTIDKQQHLW